jgi:hypothetical protein
MDDNSYTIEFNNMYEKYTQNKIKMLSIIINNFVIDDKITPDGQSLLDKYFKDSTMDYNNINLQDPELFQKLYKELMDDLVGTKELEYLNILVCDKFVKNGVITEYGRVLFNKLIFSQPAASEVLFAIQQLSQTLYQKK